MGSQSDNSPDCELGLLKRVRTPKQLKLLGFLRFVCCLVQFSSILIFFNPEFLITIIPQREVAGTKVLPSDALTLLTLNIHPFSQTANLTFSPKLEVNENTPSSKTIIKRVSQQSTEFT